MVALNCFLTQQGHKLTHTHTVEKFGTNSKQLLSDSISQSSSSGRNVHSSRFISVLGSGLVSGESYHIPSQSLGGWVEAVHKCMTVRVA